MVTLQHVVSAYAAGYTGRDPAQLSRIQWWADAIGQDTPIASVTPEMIDDALAKLIARGSLAYRKGQGVVPSGKPLQPASINRYLASLGAIFTYARRRRILPRGFVSPLKAVDKETEDNARTDYYTQAEVSRLIDSARLVRWRRLPALIATAFATGLRKGALLELRWRDIDIDNARATVGRTKNGHPIVAHLPALALQELDKLPKHRHPDTRVFCGFDESAAPDFRKAWSTAIEHAGLRPLPFHALRHSCASHLAARGASAVLLADVLGHRSLRMVARYSHLNIAARAEFVDQAFA